MKRTSLLFALVVAAASDSHAAIIPAADVLNDWTQGPTPLGDGPSNNPQITWTLANGAIETTNGSGGLFSDFVSAAAFSFSVRVRSITPEFNDNDLWGVAFGFQDSSNHYRLGWGGGGYPDKGPGPSPGVGGTGVGGLFFVRQSNGVPNLLFNDSTLHWQNNVDYDVSVFRQGSEVGFSVIRVSDSATMGAATFTDTSFTHGNVGVYVDSQSTRFADFDFTTIPEPCTFLIWSIVGLTFAAGAWWRRSKHSR